jgi:hypothetical protein
MTVTNTVPPSISGTARQGHGLMTTDGTWTFDEDYLSYEYQWLRCDVAGANCVSIAGATNSNYLLTAADVGSTIRSEVTATEHVAPPAPSEPGPIAGQGYTMVFEDDFDTLDTSVWRLANWYEAEEPSDVLVSDSVLSVYSRTSEGNPGRGAMTKAGYAWQYGYFETRMRWTANVNAFPAFWMMSDNWISTGNCTTLKVAEYDIFEAFTVGYPYNHSGALHQNTTGPCGVPDSVRQVYTTDVRTKGVVGQLPGNWHVYSGLWTSTTVSWYIDGFLLGSQPVFSTTAQPMRLFLQMSSHGAAGVDLVSEYDYVRVWQQT